MGGMESNITVGDALDIIGDRTFHGILADLRERPSEKAGNAIIEAAVVLAAKTRQLLANDNSWAEKFTLGIDAEDVFCAELRCKACGRAVIEELDDVSGLGEMIHAAEQHTCLPDILRAIELRAQAAALLADADALEAAAKAR
jgi:hypothetical protein